MNGQNGSLQELRKASARARGLLGEAERNAARIEVDITSTRNRVSELTARMLSGEVAGDLAAEAIKLKDLEDRRREAQARVAEARDLVEAADSEVEDHSQVNAQALSLEDLIRWLDDAEAAASVASMKHWIQTARDLIRAAQALKEQAPHLQLRGRPLRQVLTDALTAHFQLLPFLEGSQRGLLDGGSTLRVPADALLEDRGVSAGGKAKFHWELRAEYGGRSGTAYVDLYLER